MKSYKKYNTSFLEFSNKNYLFILFFSIFISISFAVAYFFTRLGIGNIDYKLIIFNLIISIFVLLFPLWILGYLKKYFLKNKYAFLGIEAFLTLCSLSILIMLSYIPNTYVITGLLFFTGLLLLFHFIYSLTVKKILKVNILIFIIIIAFSFWLFSSLWGKIFLSVYTNPLFRERILLGDAFIDPLFHGAISNMIKTYGIPSTGLDGPILINYHFFSHWLFARFSFIGNSNALDFYQLGYPVIFIPLLFKQLLVFIFEIKTSISNNYKELYKNTFFWLIFCTVFSGFLPKIILERFFVYPDIIVSESYCISILLIVIISGMLLFFYKINPVTPITSALKTIFFIILLPLLVLLIGISKGSVMILFIVALGYLFLRFQLYHKILYIFSLLAVITSSYFSFKIVSGAESYQYYMFHFFKTVISPRNQNLPIWTILIFFIIIYFLWAIVFLIIKIKKARIKTWKEFADNLKNNKFIDVEILLTFIIIGILPGIIFEIRGGSANYFSSTQKYISIIFLLICIPFNKLNLSNNLLSHKKNNYLKITIRKILKIFIIIILLLAFLFNTIISVKDYVQYEKNVEYSYLSAIKTGNNGKFYYKSGLLDILNELDKLPICIKKKTFIYIPHTSNNSIFWNLDLLSKTLGIPFIIPAISGIAMIDGVPDEHLIYVKNFGYSKYKITKADERIKDMEKIYISAKEKGAENIIVIDYYVKDKFVINIANETNYKDINILNFIKKNFLLTLNKIPSEKTVNDLKTLMKSGVLKPEKLSELLIIRNFNYISEINSEEYIKSLYLILLNRKHDDPGLANWLNVLKNTGSKEVVFNGFTESSEFKDIFN